MSFTKEHEVIAAAYKEGMVDGDIACDHGLPLTVEEAEGYLSESEQYSEIVDVVYRGLYRETYVEAFTTGG